MDVFPILIWCIKQWIVFNRFINEFFVSLLLVLPHAKRNAMWCDVSLNGNCHLEHLNLPIYEHVLSSFTFRWFLVWQNRMKIEIKWLIELVYRFDVVGSLLTTVKRKGNALTRQSGKRRIEVGMNDLMSVGNDNWPIWISMWAGR